MLPAQLRRLPSAIRSSSAPAGVQTCIVAVDGPGATGKTSLALWLAHLLDLDRDAARVATAARHRARWRRRSGSMGAMDGSRGSVHREGASSGEGGSRRPRSLGDIGVACAGVLSLEAQSGVIAVCSYVPGLVHLAPCLRRAASYASSARACPRAGRASPPLRRVRVRPRPPRARDEELRHWWCVEPRHEGPSCRAPARAPPRRRRLPQPVFLSAAAMPAIERRSGRRARSSPALHRRRSSTWSWLIGST
jgi:hypothetical protein